jgi:uroporphyrinogen-III synthase
MRNWKQAHILVTRPKRQAENLCALITQNQGIPVRFPTIDIIPVMDGTPVEEHLARNGYFIFTSTNAVEFYFKALDSDKIAQMQTKFCAAIGKATAQALRSVGISVDLIPQQGYNSEGLLALAEFEDVTGKEIVIIKGEQGRTTLVDILKTRGARVFCQTVYRRVMPCADNAHIIHLLDEDKIAVVTATSGEALQNLIAMLPQKQQIIIKNIPLIVMSERLKTIAINMGFFRVNATHEPSDDAIIHTISTIINGEYSD